MTRSFFQSLETHRVAYLLINGQATVLYEAADFSEVIDLWVEPSVPNIERFLAALRSQNSRFFKLTPALTEKNMKAGHGFHFVVGAEEEIQLDIMGQPPRVRAFAGAFSRRQIFDTEWGDLPVIGIKDLVEIKKTQRLRDYTIISVLARRFLDQAHRPYNSEDSQWAIENTFSLSDLEVLAHEHSGIREQISDKDISDFITVTVGEKETPQGIEDRIQERCHRNMASLQAADREYWKPIIAELRQFRTDGALMPLGALV